MMNLRKLTQTIDKQITLLVAALIGMTLGNMSTNPNALAMSMLATVAILAVITVVIERIQNRRANAIRNRAEAMLKNAIKHNERFSFKKNQGDLRCFLNCKQERKTVPEVQTGTNAEQMVQTQGANAVQMAGGEHA